MVALLFRSYSPAVYHKGHMTYFIVVRKTQSHKVHPSDILGATIDKAQADAIAKAKTQAESFMGRTYVVLPVAELPAIYLLPRKDAPND